MAWSPFVPPGAGAQVTAFGSTYTMKADGAATAGACSLVEEVFWGETTPLHRHTNAEEAFLVLSGEVAAWIDGAETLTETGTFFVLPRGVPHGLCRVSDQPVCFSGGPFGRLGWRRFPGVTRFRMWAKVHRSHLAPE